MLAFDPKQKVMRISGARGVLGAELHLCVLEDVVGNGRVSLSFPSEEARCEGGGISDVQDSALKKGQGSLI